MLTKTAGSHIHHSLGIIPPNRTIFLKQSQTVVTAVQTERARQKEEFAFSVYAERKRLQDVCRVV